MKRRILRRDALRAGLAAISGPLAMGLAGPPSREVRAFRLVESAGLRRFGYPVHAVIPDASGGRNFRLVRDDKVIPAQFREVKGPGGRAGFALDFVASPGPLDVGQYHVLFGTDVAPGPEPSGGLSLRDVEKRYLVSLGGGTLTFEIARDPGAFLKAVGGSRLAYLSDVPGGLRLLTRREGGGSRPREVGGPEWEVTRHGPLAVGFRSTQSGSDVPSTRLELTIPSSKTWVEIDATVDDPAGIVQGWEFDLNLKMEGEPTLVDLGAGSTVYGQIRGVERMELVAPAEGTSWLVRKGTGPDPATFAAPPVGTSRPAEGWAHVMDAQRCSAIAVADFGRSGVRDRISVGADGRVRVAREYARDDAEIPKGPKSLHFWVHFVPMPVQVGAATSPQSMLAPLRVEWDRPPSAGR